MERFPKEAESKGVMTEAGEGLGGVGKFGVIGEEAAS